MLLFEQFFSMLNDGSAAPVEPKSIAFMLKKVNSMHKLNITNAYYVGIWAG
jgi:hypothetical protein